MTGRTSPSRADAAGQAGGRSAPWRAGGVAAGRGRSGRPSFPRPGATWREAAGDGGQRPARWGWGGAGVARGSREIECRLKKIKTNKQTKIKPPSFLRKGEFKLKRVQPESSSASSAPEEWRPSVAGA